MVLNGMVLHGTVWNSIVQYGEGNGMVWYSIVQYGEGNGMVWFCMVWYSIVRYGDGNGIVWHGIKWCVNGNNVKVGYGITRHRGIVRKNWQ